MSALLIRRFEPGDLPAAWELHHLGLHQVGAHAGDGPWDQDFEDLVSAYIASGGEFLVGLVDGRIVAMGAIRPTGDGAAEMKRLRVHPDHQRRGNGQRILAELEARAVQLGFRRLHLDTTAKQDGARAIYLKNGYAETGRVQWRDTEMIFYTKELPAGGSSPESSSDRYRRFADDECGAYAPVYASLARTVAEDPELLDFLSGMPDRQPNLFFAAVQFISGAAGMPRDAAGLRDFVVTHGARIGDLMRTRRTQTNEIGRCALLLPALPPGPLALVEVGASAGLCLLLDRYAYAYGTARIGRPGAIRLDCAPIGPQLVPVERMPDIVWRRGLDLAPVDLTAADDVRWLLACVWVDHDERRLRLERAVEHARSLPSVVEPGDLAVDLPRVIERAPRSATLVVFHTAVLPYVDPERREAFESQLRDLSRRRDVVLISIEGPGTIPVVDALAPARTTLRFRIARTVFRAGAGSPALLGLGHPHGQDLEWLGVGTDASR